MEQSPALKTHIGMNYQLSQHTSIISTEGYEIMIVFADGFKATCTLVAYGSREPYVSACVDGVLGEQQVHRTAVKSATNKSKSA
jgi:hypothetical protein